MNRSIIIAAFVIGGSGVANSLIAKKPITPVIMGSYIFVLLTAILDMFGGSMAALASALSMLAVTYVLLTEVPWNQIIAFAQGKKP